MFITVASAAEIWNTNSSFIPGRPPFSKFYTKKACEGSKANCNPRWISELENLEGIQGQGSFALIFFAVRNIIYEMTVKIKLMMSEDEISGERLTNCYSWICKSLQWPKRPLKNSFIRDSWGGPCLALLLTTQIHDLGQFFFLLWKLSYPTWLLVSSSSLEVWQTPGFIVRCG